MMWIGDEKNYSIGRRTWIEDVKFYGFEINYSKKYQTSDGISLNKSMLSKTLSDEL